MKGQIVNWIPHSKQNTVQTTTCDMAHLPRMTSAHE